MIKLKDRLISYLLVVTMLLSLSFVAVFAENVTTAPVDREAIYAEDFFRTFASAGDVKYEAEKKVLRGEFAGIMANLLGLKVEPEAGETGEDIPKNDQYFDLEGSQTAQGSQRFIDVDPLHPMHNEIVAICDEGYMNGIAEGLFAPENEFIAVQGAKVIVDMLGYKVIAVQNGGYPNGYWQTAAELGILKGIHKQMNDVLVEKDLARLVYNALDIEVYQIDIQTGGASWIKIEGQTFATNVLNLHTLNGVMVDNGITSIYSTTKIEENQVKIDNVVARINAQTDYAREFIGRNVTAYMSRNEDDILELRYARLNGRDETVTFDVKDFVSISSTIIEYYSGDKKAAEKLSAGAVMIKNNMTVSSFSNDTFNYEIGTVTLVMNKSQVSLIILKSHEYMYVQKNDVEKEIIYGSYLGANRTTDSLSLDGYDFISVYNNDGSLGDVSSITADVVIDIEKNFPSIKITVKEGKADNFKVTRTYTEDGITYMTDGTTTYRMLQSYMSSPYTVKPTKDGIYTVFTAGEENIAVWLVAGAETKKYGFVIDAKRDRDSIDDKFYVKMYETDGKISKLYMRERIQLWGADGIKIRPTAKQVVDTHLTNYQGLVKYKVNENNEIIYLEVPSAQKNSDGQLYMFYENRNENGTRVAGQAWTHVGGSNGAWFYDGATQHMKTPRDLDDESGYAMLTNIDIHSYYNANKGRPIKFYTSKANSVIAEFVIFGTDTIDATLVETNKNFFAVEKVEESIIDDDIVESITGTYIEDGSAKKMTLYSKTDVVTELDGSKHSAFKNIYDAPYSKDANGAFRKYDVQAGDIIRVIYDPEDNTVSAADLVWRMTATNPLAPSTAKKGWLVGSTGKNTVGSFYTDHIAPNPYGLGITTQNGLQVQYPYYEGRFSGHGWLGGYGSVVKSEGNILHITTKDLTAPGVDVDNIESYYSSLPYQLEDIIVMDIDGDKVTTKVGTTADIRSYENAGNNCSRVLFANYWAVHIITVIINGG